MIQVANTIISEDIIDNDFVCNLSSCKGACCIEGDAGAPVEESELRIMKRIYPEVEPYLTDEGRAAIEAQGVYVKGEDGEWETPLINGGECAYVVRNESGWALCAIEQAYNDKKIDCDDACALGIELQVPIYKFVKNALIRKFGEEWYEELELIAEHLKEKK